MVVARYLKKKDETAPRHRLVKSTEGGEGCALSRQATAPHLRTAVSYQTPHSTRLNLQHRIGGRCGSHWALVVSSFLFWSLLFSFFPSISFSLALFSLCFCCISLIILSFLFVVLCYYPFLSILRSVSLSSFILSTVNLVCVYSFHLFLYFRHCHSPFSVFTSFSNFVLILTSFGFFFHFPCFPPFLLYFSLPFQPSSLSSLPLLSFPFLFAKFGEINSDACPSKCKFYIK